MLPIFALVALAAFASTVLATPVPTDPTATTPSICKVRAGCLAKCANQCFQPAFGAMGGGTMDCLPCRFRCDAPLTSEQRDECNGVKREQRPDKGASLILDDDGLG